MSLERTAAHAAAVRRRLFVAADLDDETRAACARVAERLRAKGWSGRWVAPANYHLTLAFLGGVDDARVAEVAATLRDVVPRLPALAVRFDIVGAFPNARRPRIAWLGSSTPVPAFGTLCGAVRSTLSALGFAFDAHADPHVTLARGGGATLAALPPLEPPRIAPLRIAALTLYESFTERAGARYEALERFALRAAATSPPAAPPSS